MILIRYAAFKQIRSFLVEKQINSKRLSFPSFQRHVNHFWVNHSFHPAIVAKLQKKILKRESVTIERSCSLTETKL